MLQQPAQYDVVIFKDFRVNITFPRTCPCCGVDADPQLKLVLGSHSTMLDSPPIIYEVPICVRCGEHCWESRNWSWSNRKRQLADPGSAPKLNLTPICARDGRAIAIITRYDLGPHPRTMVYCGRMDYADQLKQANNDIVEGIALMELQRPAFYAEDFFRWREDKLLSGTQLIVWGFALLLLAVLLPGILVMITAGDSQRFGNIAGFQLILVALHYVCFYYGLREIAIRKGRSGLWAWCSILGLIGIAVVCALSDRLSGVIGGLRLEPGLHTIVAPPVSSSPVMPHLGDSATPSSSVDIDSLERLAKLYESGAITLSEFELFKSRLSS